MLKRLVPADKAAFALGQLSRIDQNHIDRGLISKVVETFLDKRKRVHDVGEAICYTLSDRHINNESRDVYSAYARLLRKVEIRTKNHREGDCTMVEKHLYPPIRDEELAAAFGYLRNHLAYADLLPPKKILKVDWFLLRAIANEIARRRTPKCKLALLTGTVVREFVPDVNKATRELGMAYRDANMKIFRNRKKWQGERRQRKTAAATENPETSSGQIRLL